MIEKNVQKISLQLNKHYYIKSFNIVLLTIALAIIFSLLPYLSKQLLTSIMANNIFNDSNTNNICFALIYILITLSALTFYSSVSLGETAWYYGVMHKKKLCFKRFIFWFKSKFALKAIKLKILLFSIKLLWCTLFCIPPTVLIIIIISLALTGGIETYLFFSLLSGAVVLLFMGLLFSFIINQRYFLSKYLLTENPRLAVIQVIKQSKNLMDGQIFRLVKFKLAFIPAFLLYLFIFPIIFIHPHYKQCCCIIAKELRL